jgi:hypothetical protein
LYESCLILIKNRFFTLYLCCSLPFCGGARSESQFLVLVSATQVLGFPVLSSPPGLSSWIFSFPVVLGPLPPSFSRRVSSFPVPRNCFCHRPLLFPHQRIGFSVSRFLTRSFPLVSRRSGSGAVAALWFPHRTRFLPARFGAEFVAFLLDPSVSHSMLSFHRQGRLARCQISIR